jgi:hypothetical protein
VPATSEDSGGSQPDKYLQTRTDCWPAPPQLDNSTTNEPPSYTVPSTQELSSNMAFNGQTPTVIVLREGSTLELPRARKPIY